MGSRWSCSPGKSMRAIKRPSLLLFFWLTLRSVAIVPLAAASGDAPQWMHTLVGTTLPAYDEKTDAVLLYSDTNVTVLSADRIRTHIREAYKILRPDGRKRGTVGIYFDRATKITSQQDRKSTRLNSSHT